MGKAWPALDIYIGHPNAAAALRAPAAGCDPQLQELVLAELDDFHPTAIQEGEDDSAKLRAFFPAADARDAAARTLRLSFANHLFVESLDVPDEDWAARSQAQLRAINVGRVTICPPWDAVRGSDLRTVPGSDPVVVIQPSMGFGTGHHPTTRLVLRALQKLPLENRTVLDIGCGSGVLAIAAVKLGARGAIAIDVDPDAIENARENVELSGVSGQVRLEQADFRELTATADVVVANLTGGLIERTAEQLAQLVAPGGHLVVSGFMNTEETVTRILAKFLFLREVDAEDEWLCAIYSKPGLA